MRSEHLVISLHGRNVEVPRAQLAAELSRQGPVASLALIEAIVGTAPRHLAVERLSAALEGAGTGTQTLAALLGLVRLAAIEAVPALDRAASTLPGPLAITARIAQHLLAAELDALCGLIGSDDLAAQRAPLVLTVVPTWPRGGERLAAALFDALARLQPTLGITAYRAMLGDLAEVFFRAIQHGAAVDAVLGAHREELVDRLCAELPGTPDLVAARGMAWLLGVLGPTDDAIRSAIERARTRFRDPAFHRDCLAMLGEDATLAWPPRTVG